MDPTTITDAPAEQPGGEQPQPEVPAETPAVTEPTSEQPQVNPNPDEPAQGGEEEKPANLADNPEEEDDPVAFWAKKNIDINTPEGMAAATKSYRESVKAMSEKGKTASDLAKELKQSTTALDPDASKAEQALAVATALQNAEIIRNWREENKVTPAEDVTMAKYVKENPEIGELVNIGSITLDQLRAMSGALTPPKPVDTAKIKQQGGQEALQSLASKQIASAPGGNAAVNHAQASKGNSMQELEERLANVKF